mmetsp:Transcript_20943/g.62453  ORF Transcript_20943/g.62453 Transcript_20943/m.62453 type:complete len:569 (-) Transcript_20943:140-1846(-)
MQPRMRSISTFDQSHLPTWQRPPTVIWQQPLPTVCSRSCSVDTRYGDGGPTRAEACGSDGGQGSRRSFTPTRTVPKLNLQQASASSFHDSARGPLSPEVYETRNWTDYLASEDFRALLDQVDPPSSRSRPARSPSRPSSPPRTSDLFGMKQAWTPSRPDADTPSTALAGEQSFSSLGSTSTGGPRAPVPLLPVRGLDARLASLQMPMLEKIHCHLPAVQRDGAFSPAAPHATQALAPVVQLPAPIAWASPRGSTRATSPAPFVRQAVSMVPVTRAPSAAARARSAASPARSLSPMAYQQVYTPRRAIDSRGPQPRAYSPQGSLRSLSPFKQSPRIAVLSPRSPIRAAAGQNVPVVASIVRAGVTSPVVSSRTATSTVTRADAPMTPMSSSRCVGPMSASPARARVLLRSPMRSPRACPSRSPARDRSPPPVVRTLTMGTSGSLAGAYSPLPRSRSIAVTSPAPVRTASPVPVASSFRCLSPAASVRLAGAAVRAASPLVFATPVQRPRLPPALKVWQPLATQQHLMLQQLGVPGESHLLRPGAFEQVAGASLLTRTLSSWSAPGSPLY